jgi:hypothetical protein
VDAVAVAADQGRTSTLPGRILAYGRTRPERGFGSVEGGGRLVVASLAGRRPPLTGAWDIDLRHNSATTSS